MRFSRRTRSTRTPLLYALGVLLLALLIFTNARIAQSGALSPFSAATALIEFPLSALLQTVARTGSEILSLPHVHDANAVLRNENISLREEVRAMRETMSVATRERTLQRIADIHRHAIMADCVGYDPENVQRSITLDKGSVAGVTLDSGVISAEGVVGHVVAVSPISSTVLLLNSYTSNIPAIVQNGRFWGIIRGSLAHLKLDDVTLDAPLRIGDLVVTGRGRSFPAGVPIGRILSISRSDAALTQTAVVEPSVRFSRLERVLVLPHVQP